MPAPKAITPGDRCSRWTVLDKSEMRHYPSGAQQLFWMCRCDCGTEQWVGDYKLRTGHSRSCGCLQAGVTTKRSLKHGHSKRGERTSIYGIWRNMVSRCTNPNMPEYARYGARGITLCERWMTFENFLEDMGEPPEGLTLDRLDNNGNYHKENCCWRTPVEQARNRRNTINVTFNGETRPLIEWCERLGLSYRTIRARHAAGWSTEELFTVPIGTKRGA
jgi:hypothetical protein